MRYVALLRGINVGPTTRVAMATLTAIFIDAGCVDVVTVLNSGNVVFSAATKPDAASLAARVKNDTGVTTRIVVVDGQRLRSIADRMPFEGDDSRRIVSFADGPPASGIVRPAAVELAPEQLEVGVDAIYQHCPNGVSNSTLTPAFWKQFAPETTARNIRTVRKLIARL